MNRKLKEQEILQQNRIYFNSEQYNEAIIFMFNQLLACQSDELIGFEEDLIYALNKFTEQLLKYHQIEKILWLWKKCLELTNNRSSLLYYSYSKLTSSLLSFVHLFSFLFDCTELCFQWRNSLKRLK